MSSQLLFSFSFYSGKIYQLSPCWYSSSKKLSADTLLCYKTGYNSSVISIKRYSVGEHRESLCETLWFHIVPLFFIKLLTVPRDYTSFTLHWSLGLIFILMPIVSAMPFQVGVHHLSQTSFHSIDLKVPSQYLQSAIRSYRYFPADHFTETLGWTKLCDGVNHQTTTDLTPS